MSLLEDARTALAAALDGIGVPVHVYPTGAVSAPCVVIIPDHPYWSGTTLGGVVSIGLQVQIVTANQRAMDPLIEVAIDLLVQAGLHPDEVPVPVVDNEVSTISTRIPVVMEWRE